MTSPRTRAPSWRRYLRFWGTDVRADVSDELEFHIDMRASEYEAQGMTAADARRAAHARFGDVGRVDAALRAHDRRQSRSEQLRESLMAFGNELRYAIRTLGRAPGFTVAAVLCLALGTGVNATVFSVVNALLFRPLPVDRPANLVVVASTYTGETLAGDNSYPDYLDIRAEHGVFEAVAAYTVDAVSLRVGDRTERRTLEPVSDNYWSMLGVHMARGRAFTSEEVVQRTPLIVLSYRLWQQEFGGANDVVGRTAAVNGIPMTIVGVAPREFDGALPFISADGWIPATMLRALDPSGGDPLVRRNGGGFKVLGRLRGGVGLSAARSALGVVAHRLQSQYPAEDQSLRFVIAPELRARPDIAVSDVMPRVGLVFMALAALVLLIACGNVASLMLARSTGRQTEHAVRMALGARRARLVRQALTESTVVAAGGAVVGIILALFVVRWVNSVPFTSDYPVSIDLKLDWRVVFVTAVAALVAATVSGVGPAVRTSDPRVGDALREGARGGVSGVGRQRFRTSLVAAQVAVSFLLLVSAGLFVRSVQRAGHVDLGFRQDHVVIAMVDVSLGRYDRARGQQFFRTLEQRAAELPGVRAVALSHTLPLGTNHSDVDVYADLASLVAEKGHAHMEGNTVTPGYFAALGIRLMAGRDFTLRDDSAAPRVVVVNAAAARRLWPGADPVGRRFRLDPKDPEVQVIGLVGTVTSVFINEVPRPMVYMPFAQHFEPNMAVHVVTEGDPQQSVQPLRALVASIDANLAPYGVRTMYTHLHEGIAFTPVQLAAAFAAGIGLLGLAQALIGLYGVVAYSVAMRGREIGIRMAMGATAGSILRSVLREGMLVTAAGLALGVVLAIATTRILGSLLIDIGARDPLTFLVLAAALAGATFAACCIPAWRAARVAPAQVIRGE